MFNVFRRNTGDDSGAITYENMTYRDLIEISDRIAKHIRTKIPRSYNRIRTAPQTNTEWVTNITTTPYASLVGSLVRMSITTDTSQWHEDKFKKSIACNKSPSEVKQAIRSFLQLGVVGGSAVNLSYKDSKQAEKDYGEKFFAALALKLNASGFRWGEGRDAQLKNAKDASITVVTYLSQTDRMYLDRYQVNLTLNNTPMPFTYIRALSKSAMEFKVGNCEECACAAFAMFLRFKDTQDQPLHNAPGQIRVELVKAKTGVGGGHFFVLLNRPETEIKPAFQTWFNNRDVIVCDPWISDKGVGGIITSVHPAIQELREYLVEEGNAGPNILHVRAAGHIADNPAEFQNNPIFQV